MTGVSTRIRARLGALRRRGAIRRVMAVEGMIAEAEAEELMRLASKVPTQQCIVEVGSYRGRSTTALALGSKAAPVYAIDPHEAFEGIYGGEFGPADRRAFFENLLKAGVVERVRLVNLSSEVASQGWNRTIGLLWVDGDHSLEGARRDFEAWRPFLEPGSTVAFHDARDPKGGPARLIETLVGSGEFRHHSAVGDIVALRLKGPARGALGD
jgi:predicted O-methyltransferase YrrM